MGQAPRRRGQRLTVAGSSKGFGQANGQPSPNRAGGTKEQGEGESKDPRYFWAWDFGFRKLTLSFCSH